MALIDGVRTPLERCGQLCVFHGVFSHFGIDFLDRKNVLFVGPRQGILHIDDPHVALAISGALMLVKYILRPQHIRKPDPNLGGFSGVRDHDARGDCAVALVGAIEGFGRQDRGDAGLCIDLEEVAFLGDEVGFPRVARQVVQIHITRPHQSMGVIGRFFAQGYLGYGCFRGARADAGYRVAHRHKGQSAFIAELTFFGFGHGAILEFLN